MAGGPQMCQPQVGFGELAKNKTFEGFEFNKSKTCMKGDGQNLFNFVGATVNPTFSGLNKDGASVLGQG